MAVITRYIIVRNGVELDKVFTDKKEAEAYDKMLDAADDLSQLIKGAPLEIDVDSETVDAIAIYLAKNALEVTKILKSIKTVPAATPKPTDKEKEDQAAADEDKKKTPEPKTKTGRKGTER